MKATKAIRIFGVLSTAALLSLGTACSSSQQDEEDLELSDDENSNQQGNLGEDDAAEGNGQENFEEGTNDYEGNQGADVNSETTNEFEDGGDQFFNAGNNANTGNANMNTGMNAAPVNDGMNAAPVNAAMNAAPVNMGMTGGGAVASPSERAPIPGGRVRYVREGGVQIVNSPGGSPVASLEQGDHPVTWEENGWLRISNGMYVPIDAMSDKGVSRASGMKAWNQ